MALSSDVIREFAKQAIGETETVSAGKEVTGTATVYNGKYYVTLDGTDQLTPILSSTVGMKAGDRVTVLIADHTAKVTGNVTDPSTQKSTFENYSDDTNTKISEFETVIAGKVDTDALNAQIGRIDTLTTDNVLVKERLTATEASIGTLEAKDVEISGKVTALEGEIDKLDVDSLTTEKLDAKYATVENLTATNQTVNNLSATYGKFEIATTEKLEAQDASIKTLDSEKLSVTDAEAKYANIDFANIGKAAIESFFTKSGMIGDLVVGDGTITGTLVGVTIKGDLIEGGTVKADKLVVKGSDGLFYKLNTDGVTTSAEQTDENSLNGSVITAKSITAEKVSVNDLVAFGATIGGFHITDSSIYSGTKESATNTVRGVFMDDDGELAVGDGTNYLRYYRDEEGNYKLELSASSVMLKAGSVSVADAIDAATTKADAAKEAADSVKETADSAKETAEAASTAATEAKQGANSAQVNAERAQETASAAVESITNNINPALDAINASIASMVQGADGTSLMTQDENGWHFDITSIQSAIQQNASSIEGVSGDVANAQQVADAAQELANAIAEKTAYITIGTYEDMPCMTLGAQDSPFKARITNTALEFMQGEQVVAYISNQQLYIKASTVVDELKIGDETGYIWKRRENGHLGLRYVGGQYNLLSGTADFSGRYSWDCSSTGTWDGLTYITQQTPSSGYIDMCQWLVTDIIQADTDYTLSFWAKTTASVSICSYLYPDAVAGTQSDGATVRTISNTGWQRFSVTWRTASSLSGIKYLLPLRLMPGNTAGISVSLCGVKLELGTVATEWMPSANE